MFRRHVTRAESKDNLALAVVGPRNDFFGFPGDFIVFEWVCWGNAFTVHDKEVFVEVDADINLVEAVFPLLVDFIFESEFDVAAADLAAVDKK